MTQSLLLTHLRLVPMDGPPDAPLGEVRDGALRIVDGVLTDVGPLTAGPDDTVIDGGGRVAVPGFVQGHVHFCQTLFRGCADDLPLMAWLHQRIWPLEAAHDAASTRAAAELGVAELLRGGTTTVQAMESVRHGEVTAEVADTAGLTTILGNCLMDVEAPGTPAGFATTTAAALRISDELRRICAAAPRLHYAVSPRFILSCSDDLSRAAAGFATEHRLRVHTHACEHPEEIALVREQTGRDYIHALDDQGLLGPTTSLAHCVHTTEDERQRLLASGTAVLHCPSTNLKLGSGLAPIATYRRMGLRVALGADGAPCNNRLSMLTELRQAALLQATAATPGDWPAAAALWTATQGGAEALGLGHEVGSLRPGKRADVVFFDLDGLELGPGGDVATRIVYAAETSAIRDVMLGGRFVVRDGALTEVDPVELRLRATNELRGVLARAGLAR